MIVLPATIYVQTTLYQFRLSCLFKCKVMSNDGQGFTIKSYNFEKNYSLKPHQSLSFTNRIREIQLNDQKIAYVEACIKNHLPFAVSFSKLECTGTTKATFLGLLGYDDTTVVPEETSMKLVAKYSLDSNYVSGCL